jgi:hypothetical protein
VIAQSLNGVRLLTRYARLWSTVVWDRSYFEATAQLLPVLYLAALIEYRLFRPMEQTEKEKPWIWGSRRLLIFYVGLTFAFAEVSALKVLATRVQTSNDRGLSVGA